MKKILFSLIILWCSQFLGAQQNITITGVDSSEMLLNGKIHVYVSLQNIEELKESGLPGLEDFSLTEKESLMDEWSQQDIRDLQFNGVNQDQISFILLLDNSGSMYDTINARPTENSDEQRIHFVTKALEDLFYSTSENNDSLSIVSFNTNIKTLAPFTDSRSKLRSALESISRPEPDEAYTELYRAMKEASDSLSLRKGRKVLILLTDGENYSYSENRKEPHPVYGNELIDLDDIETEMQKRGISLYTIHYARAEDPELSNLSDRTGGLSYTASSGTELLSAYKEIHERISNEFRLSYKPAVSAARERSIKVTLNDTETSPEYSFLWEIFWGLSPLLSWWVYLILIVLSLVLILVIHRTPFEKVYAFPHLELLGGEADKTIIQISQDKTMIAVSREQTRVMDETEIGSMNSDETGITIIRGPEGKYSLKADEEIMVNNKTVISRDLEPGDVIRSGETVIIFEEPPEDQ
ncbi:MAG: VWA domain-containing protein [Spirochaetales bacterium]|nr:VWA domain-containing protein [Spirochaetales bacterium]